MWILKKNQSPFVVVDGEMKGKSFTHGVTYSSIPDVDKLRFNKVKNTPPKSPGKVEVEKDA